MPVKKPLGLFERGGETREAYTPGEVISLRNAGWSPVAPPPPAPPEPKPKPPQTPRTDAVVGATKLKRSHKKKAAAK